ncbi:MAG: hypothetical protein ABMA02_14945 [Saprospiraceae bacterium]
MVRKLPELETRWIFWIVGFLFDTGKWLYIFPQGEGHFYMELDSDTAPEETITRWDFVEMEKPMQILQVFE